MVQGLKIPDLIAAFELLMLCLATWTGDIMITNAYELIVYILTLIQIYEPILNVFQLLGMSMF